MTRYEKWSFQRSALYPIWSFSQSPQFSKESAPFDINTCFKNVSFYFPQNSIWNRRWNWIERKKRAKLTNENHIPISFWQLCWSIRNLLAENKILHNLRKPKSISKKGPIEEKKKTKKNLSNFVRWFCDGSLFHFCNPFETFALNSTVVRAHSF